LPNLVPATFTSNLFNARDVIMMVSFSAVFSALLFYYLPKFGKAVLILLILIQYGLFIHDGNHIVIKDGVFGLSSRRSSLSNAYVKSHYDYGKIMFDDFSRAANPVDIG